MVASIRRVARRADGVPVRVRRRRPAAHGPGSALHLLHPVAIVHMIALRLRRRMAAALMGPRVTRGRMAPIARMTSSANRMGPVTIARPHRPRGGVLMAFRLSRLKGAVWVTVRLPRHVGMTTLMAVGLHPRIRRRRICLPHGRMIAGSQKTARRLRRHSVRPPTGGFRRRILLRRTRLPRHIRPLRRSTAARRPRADGVQPRIPATVLRLLHRKAGIPRTVRLLLRLREGTRGSALPRRPRGGGRATVRRLRRPKAATVPRGLTARTTVRMAVPMAPVPALMAVLMVPARAVPARRGRRRAPDSSLGRARTVRTAMVTTIPMTTTPIRMPIITSIAALSKSRASSMPRT